MTAIKTAFSVIAAIGLIAAGAFVGIPALTGTASAQEAHGQSYASVTEINGTSQNGQVETVQVSSSGEVHWEHMPNGVETVRVDLAVKHDGEYETFATRDYDVNGSSDGVYNYGTSEDSRVTGELIENTSYDASDFSADEDGEINKESLDIRVTVTVIGPDGVDCVFTEKHKLKTEVTNLHNPAAGGDTNIDGDIGMDHSDDDCVECVPYEGDNASHGDEGHHTDGPTVADSESGLPDTPTPA